MSCDNCKLDFLPGKVIRTTDDLKHCAVCGELIVSPFSRDAINRMWPIFQNQVRDRLCVGAKTYGDLSFTSSLDDTLKNIAEELLDVCGWSFIEWCKVMRLRESIKNAT